MRAILAAVMMAATPAVAAEAQLDRPFSDLYDTTFVDNQARPVAGDKLADALKGYDVIVYGEIHGHPGVHLQQMKLLKALHDRNPKLIVSFEQFEADVQGVIDDYFAGRIGENALKDKGRAWPQYATAYRPMVEFARHNQLPVIASNAPGWAISCIGQFGPEILDRFTPEDRALVANDLHMLKTGAYRDKYMAFAGGGSHGGGDKARAERSYAAQVARDDTMAQSIAAALNAHPGAKLIHYNGYFHSADFLGTVERLKLRKPDVKIAVITPVEVEHGKTTADLNDAGDATLYQLVQASPPTFVDGEDMSGFLASMKRTPCKYAPETAKP